MLENKKGQTGGLVTGLVMGIAGLVIGVIIAFVIINTLVGSNLLTGNPTEEYAVNYTAGNFSLGINQVASKLPTVLLVAAIVLILGVLAVLVGVWNRMRTGGATI